MKQKTVYVCRDCGYESSKWIGRCSACGAWNTMEEFTPARESKQGFSKLESSALPDLPVPIREVTCDDVSRRMTGIEEFDRVLGGGIVSGSLILLGGDPGIGKSTILLQVCAHLAGSAKVLYVSGEESKHQLKLRASRLTGGKEMGMDNVFVMSEVNMEAVFGAVAKLSPDVLIVDSVQTMFNPELDSAPGSVSQIRDVTMSLMRLAKGSRTTVFLVGHVTKDGAIAGPKLLEHMVDTVLYFEGDEGRAYRILRAVKNRFGSTNEIGVFEMTSDGLSEVENPSAALLAERGEGEITGSAVLCLMEGSRPLLAEAQALVSRSFLGTPRRTASGFDTNRLSMLLAVLEKKLNLNFSTQDVYVNIVGGIRAIEPCADLGICMALSSSFLNFSMPHGILFLGEVGLSGELRSISNLERRLSEAEKMGFTSCVIPTFNQKKLSQSFSMEIFAAGTLSEVIRLFHQ